MLELKQQCKCMANSVEPAPQAVDDDDDGDDAYDYEAYIAEYGRAYLLKHLLIFGFTSHTADKICQSIPEELIGLQTPAYWATRYIEYISRYPEEP